MMNTELLRDFFMWCSILNIGLMVLSLILLIAGGDFAYKIHSRWFDFSRRTFDIIAYSFLGAYKVLIIVFCVIPWIALSIVQ